MPIVAEAATAIRADFSKFPADLKRGVQKPIDGLGARIKKALSPANLAGTVAGTLGGLFVVSKAVDFIGNAISAASDLNETITKTSQIFGQQALPGLEAWAETAATTLGQSKQQALDAASSFAIFGKSAGLSGDELVGFSTELTQLSSDFASFFNTSPEDAIVAIGAALRGESEPIRRYGVLLDDATLRQRALTLGIVNTTKKALTPQQRVLAAQAEILAQTADAQGDFARTSTGLANTQRINAAKLQDAMAELGTALLPVATQFATMAGDVLPDVVKAFGEVLKIVGPLAKELIPVLAAVMAVKLVTALGSVTNGLKLMRSEAVLTSGALTAVFAGGILVGQQYSSFIEKMAVDAVITKWKLSAEEFGQVMAAVGNDTPKALELIDKAGGNVSEALALMSAKGGDVESAFKAIDQAGGSVHVALGYVQDDARETARAAGLANQNLIENAAVVAEVIPKSFKDAVAEAKAAAAALPGDVADAILAGKKDLQPIRKLMRDIIAGSVSDAVTLAQDAALLLNPKIAQALTGNSTEAQDAMLTQVVEPLIDSILTLEPNALEAGADVPKSIKKALDQNGQLAVGAMRDLMGDENASLAQLEVFARARGLDSIAALIHAMREKKREVKDAAADVAGTAGGALDFSPAARAAGKAVITAYMDAMESTIGRRVTGFENKVGTLLGVISGAGSPWYTKFTEVGEGAGKHYMDALEASMGGGLSGVSGLMNSRVLPAMGAPQSSVGGGNTFNVHTGSVPREKSMLEIVREMRRAEYLGMLTNG